MTILYEAICINRQTKHGHLVSKISISKDNTTAKIQHTLDGKSFDFLFSDLPTCIYFLSSSGGRLLQQQIAKLDIAKQYVAYIGCVGLYNESIILDVSDNATSENCDIILISEDELKLFNQNHIEAIKKAIEYQESVIENTNLSMVFVENGNVMKAKMNKWKMKRLPSSSGYTIPEPSFSHPSVTIKAIWHVHYHDELDKNEFCYYDLHHCNISDELINEFKFFREEIEKIRLACYHINELKRKLDEAYQFSKKINEICNSNTKQSPLVQLSYQELKQKEKEYDLAFNEGGDGFNPYRAYLEEKFNEPIPMSKDLETKPDC
jgi:hypothetical protein